MGDNMRLVCPNCGAQYEVDDALIPAGGRDVQCSNCGHSWFQSAAGAAEPEEITEEITEEAAAPEESFEEAEYEEEAEAAREEEEPEAAVEPEEEPEPWEEPEAEEEPEPEPWDEPEAEPEPEEQLPGPRRQVLDESLAEVLREEAERERRAREAEATASTWEEQVELGLDEAAPAPGAPSPAPEEHVARLRGIEPEYPETGPGSRRDLLPDIEEINHTLRSTSERKSAEAKPEQAEPAPRRGRFGLGFSLVIILAAWAAVSYVFAPQIAERLPQLGPALDGYVAAVDRMRIGLEVGTNLLIEKIAGLTG
jgi:predicted Zn finger-like uncharacterized protein